VEAAGYYEGVVEAGDDDEGGDGEDEVVEESGEAFIGITGVENGEENQSDLEKGGGFAEETGRERAVALNDENNGGDDEHEHIAAEDDDGEPPGDFFTHGENDEGRGEQQFVGDGIEIGAKGGFLLEGASEKAVDDVGEGDEHEDDESPTVFVVDDQNEEERQNA